MADARDEAVWTNHARECKDAGRVPFEFTEDNKFRVAVNAIKTKGKRVLDLGCGPGYWAPLFKGFNYTGYDQNQGMIDLAKEINPKLKFIQGPTLDMFAPESFDIVFSAGVLQHNRHEPDKANLARQINRILKQGGYYLCTENTFREDNMPVSVGNPDYTDGYSFTPHGWEKFITQFGFQFEWFTGPSEYLFSKI